MPRGVYERKPKSKKEDTVADETTTEATEQDPAVTDQADEQGELCVPCWPDGWQGDQDAAECSHGAWARWPE